MITKHIICKRKFSIFICLLLSSITFVRAQVRLDSINQLPEVVVVAKPYREVIPAQKLNGKELKALSSFSVADAIRYFSGVQIKDYGGIGGLKTINIRSMGSNHVGIFYDGIQLGNAQNGQVDLGKFSLDNIDEICVYNGQKSDIFQSAKDFGSSGTVYIRSRMPQFQWGKKDNLKVMVKTGSFDLINPSILYEHKFGDKLKGSVSAELVNASGKYKFRYRRVLPNSNTVAYDTTAIRKNGDVFSQRIEAGLYGMLNEGEWKAKFYFYNSERGIPGAIVNNRWMNAQRQWDRNFFVQNVLRKKISERYQLQISGKYAVDYMRYLNPDTTLLLIDNHFTQQELYGSIANKYAINDFWDLSLSLDQQYNTLRSNMKGFVYPSRYTSMLSLATAIERSHIKAQASILGTYVKESVQSGDKDIDEYSEAAPSRKKLTPAIFVSYQPWEEHAFNIRAFYKSIFRMPTFNDLYYTNIGNTNLRPEYTHQYNLGFLYDKMFLSKRVRHASLQVDAYYNEVTDKIVAVPKGSGQYRWMMMNLGYVKIKGIDVAGSLQWALGQDCLLNLKGTYTYQKAQDFTHRESPELEEITWGGQIAYIPWHSGSVLSTLVYKTWQFNYSFIYIGERYHNSDNSRINYEQPWYTSDLSFSKTLKIRGINSKIGVEINNLLSQDYEVIMNYPMPKRNYKLIFSIDV